MPYFIYRVPNAENEQVSFLAEVADYRAAKQDVSARRINRSEDDDAQYRMVFAENRQEARRLLTTKRKMSSPLEEWEEKL